VLRRLPAKVMHRIAGEGEGALSSLENHETFHCIRNLTHNYDYLFLHWLLDLRHATECLSRINPGINFPADATDDLLSWVRLCLKASPKFPPPKVLGA
jgi:hypothetical protein